jgi:hypothetical protein
MVASDPMVKILHHQNSFKIHREIKETESKAISLTRSFSWLGTGTSIEMAGLD